MRDPLVLGSGAFDVQDLCGELILKLSDARERWMVSVERDAHGGLVARED